MKKECCFFALLSLALLPGVLSAEEKKNEPASEPRYMLRSDVAPQQTERTRVTAADFQWDALTGKSPAAGNEPVVGQGSKRAYYEFKDGQKYPYYISEDKK